MKWFNADLANLNRIVRVQMTKHQIHYTNSADDRIVPPRRWGGRVVFDVHHLCATQITQLNEDFNSKRDNPLYNNICDEDKNYTSRNHSDSNDANIHVPPLEQVSQEWR